MQGHPSQGASTEEQPVTAETESDLSALLHEERRFEPPAALAQAANAQASLYDDARADRIAFWEQQARRLTWDTEWTTPLEWEAPFAKWFVGGRINASVNCLDRHLDAGR